MGWFHRLIAWTVEMRNNVYSTNREYNYRDQEKQKKNIKDNGDGDYCDESDILGDETQKLRELNEATVEQSEWISELAFYVLESDKNNNHNITNADYSVESCISFMFSSFIGVDLQRLAL